MTSHELREWLPTFEKMGIHGKQPFLCDTGERGDFGSNLHDVIYATVS